MANGVNGTYSQLTLGEFLEQTSGPSAVLAKTSARQDSESDSRETGAVSLEEYLILSGKPIRDIVPDGLSMRMLEACYQRTEEETISRYSWLWMDLGMMSNGKISTVDTSESLRTEKGSTLLDILESPDQVGKEYFLSADQMARIVFL